MTKKREYIAGERFGKLVFVTEVPPIQTGREMKRAAIFQCDCGEERTFIINRIITGRNRSCGKCLYRIRNRENSKKHGMRFTRFYSIWRSMKGRCLQKSHEAYERYGGRGIKVSKEWLSFMNFKQDMFPSYVEHVRIYGEEETSIDRINNRKGYSVDNCRWATRLEQANNKLPREQI